MTAKNNLLTDRLSYTGNINTPTHFYLYDYTPGEIKEYTCNNYQELSIPLSTAGYTHWLQICGLQNTGDIELICTFFGIKFLIMQDILNPNHPCKVEEYERFNIVVAKYFDSDTESQISIVQGESFVLTFTEYENNAFREVEKALRNNILGIRARTTDYLLTVLTNTLAANYISVSGEIDNALDDLESELLSDKNIPEIGAQIQALRRRYMQLKRAVIPLKEQYNRLIKSDSSLIHKANRVFFSDLNDHFTYVTQNIDICRETLSSLVDLYISNNDLRMNSIMKQLTIISTIFIPLTFLVGVWGMNFDYMPELRWHYGYFAAWGIMVVIGIATYFILRSKKWE